MRCRWLSDGGNYWTSTNRAGKLRAADLRNRRTVALAKLFDENAERRDVEAIKPQAPTGVVLRPDG